MGLGNISSSAATFRTHVYEVIEYYDGSWHALSTPVWYPSTINDATCTYTLLLENLTATDIEKLPEDKISVRLTPNPTNDKAFLRYVLPDDAYTLRIDLHDINGKIIRNIYNGEQGKGIYSREINVNDLSSGLYFVHLYSEDFSITKKLNKQ
ncbi:MAG: T9SS type A sorting domain-containing protein [Bacteroidetes bacterium]|nr:T9SS type A sorting domain-containing protein [Bacteroidota bacterium]